MPDGGRPDEYVRVGGSGSTISAGASRPQAQESGGRMSQERQAECERIVDSFRQGSVTKADAASQIVNVLAKPDGGLDPNAFAQYFADLNEHEADRADAEQRR